jgi:hypothetical protein
MAIKIPEEDRDTYPYSAWHPEDVMEGIEV